MKIDKGELNCVHDIAEDFKYARESMIYFSILKIKKPNPEIGLF